MKVACDGSCESYQKRPLDVPGWLWAQISLYFFQSLGKYNTSVIYSSSSVSGLFS